MTIGHDDDDANNVESCNCENSAKGLDLDAGTAACSGRQVNSKLELQVGTAAAAVLDTSTGQQGSNFISSSKLHCCCHLLALSFNQIPLEIEVAVAAVLDIGTGQQYWTAVA